LGVRRRSRCQKQECQQRECCGCESFQTTHFVLPSFWGVSCTGERILPRPAPCLGSARLIPSFLTQLPPRSPWNPSPYLISLEIFFVAPTVLAAPSWLSRHRRK
jgi:hypothetical protein